MTKGKAIKNSLRLVNIYNDMRDMLDKQETMQNIGREEFNELLNVRSLVHDAIMESLEDMSSSDDRIMILNRI